MVISFFHIGHPIIYDVNRVGTILYIKITYSIIYNFFRCVIHNQGPKILNMFFFKYDLYDLNETFLTSYPIKPIDLIRSWSAPILLVEKYINDI